MHPRRNSFAKFLPIFVGLYVLMVFTIRHKSYDIVEAVQNKVDPAEVISLDLDELDDDPDSDYENVEEMTFVVILCEGSASQGPSLASNIDRQIRQLTVMLKSIAMFKINPVHLIIVSDSEPLFTRALSDYQKWPEKFKEGIRFTHKNLWFPPGRSSMKSMFRVCATERLFLPDMLTDLDAAIYIDTDFIFFRPPEDLWNIFSEFDKNQLSAMGPCLNHYGTKRNKVPYFGKTGLNAGVMLMNLTRMRTLSPGWSKQNLDILDNYKNDIKLADQDILNILFSQHPELMYELSCVWNYRPFQCSSGHNNCGDAEELGVSMIHGNALSFADDHELLFRSIFNAFENFSLSKGNLKDLVNTLERNVMNVIQNQLSSDCKKVDGIDFILLNELRKHI